MYKIYSTDLYRIPRGAKAEVSGKEFVVRQKLSVGPLFRAGTDPTREIVVSGAVFGLSKLDKKEFEEVEEGVIVIKGEHPFKMAISLPEKTVRINEPHSSYVSKGIIMFFYTYARMSELHIPAPEGTVEEEVAYWCDAVYSQSLLDDEGVTVLIAGEDFPVEEFPSTEGFTVRMTKEASEETEATHETTAEPEKSLEQMILDGDFRIESPDDETLVQAMYPGLDYFDGYVINEATKYVVKKAHKAMLAGEELMRKYGFDINAIPETEYQTHMKKNACNIAMIGDPGSGKTSVGSATAAAIGAACIIVACSANTEESAFQGSAKLKEGELVFDPGAFASAFQHKSILVLDEANFAQPSVLGILNNALVNPCRVDLDGCRPVRRDPRCVIISCHNVGTIGTDSLNEAFDRRFKYTLVVEPPTRDEFIEFLVRYNPNKKLCEWVYNAYSKIKDGLKAYNDPVADEAYRAIAVDSCFAVIDDIEDGFDPIKSLSHIWAKVYDRNKVYAEEIRSNVVEKLPLYRR